ncbi:MAG: hypothetical protein HQ542_02645 [Bacteroidia bacterium]|nr:hypothetical protein [Bacteroidia bacterium]
MNFTPEQKAIIQSSGNIKINVVAGFCNGRPIWDSKMMSLSRVWVLMP